MGGEDSTDFEKVYGCCPVCGMNDGPESRSRTWSAIWVYGVFKG